MRRGGFELKLLGVQQSIQMQKPTLAEQVLQKMKEKKEIEERNRPHYEVMKLDAIFSHEFQKYLKDEISILQQQVKKGEETLQMLEEHAQELDSTGKKDFLRIIIKPDFIASQRVDGKKKQFYIKSANTFLRTQILRNRKYQRSCLIENQLIGLVSTLKDLEDASWTKQLKERKVYNEKRVIVLKEELRLKDIQQEVSDLKECIKRERQQKIELLRQYELKKINADNRRLAQKQIQKKILEYKTKIEETYNPITYREHLKKIFQFQTKNQMLARNIENVRYRVKTVERETEKYQKSLQKSNVFSKLGLFYSPLAKKRKKNSIKTESQSLFNKDSKFLPSKISISVNLTEFSLPNQSKDLQRSKQQKDANIFAGCSPKTSMRSTQLSNFPRYRSAFSKRR